MENILSLRRRVRGRQDGDGVMTKPEECKFSKKKSRATVMQAQIR